MDGGRVLRALLALKLEYLRATSIAAQLAKAFAFLFGVIGLFSNPFLVFIAFFVWEGAEEEAAMARQRLSLSGLPVSQAMLTRYDVLQPQNTLKEAAQLLLASSQVDFPVVENGHLVGLLTREALLRGLNQLGEEAPVGESMIAPPVELQPQQRLDEAFALLQQSGLRTLPVTDQGELVGLLTLENIGEFLLIRAAHHTA
jgi:CBS domain-containing protein